MNWNTPPQHEDCPECKGEGYENDIDGTIYCDVCDDTKSIDEHTMAEYERDEAESHLLNEAGL